MVKIIKKSLKKKKKHWNNINSDESVNIIEEDINFFKIIQFNFLTFKDGRPFSEAKKLRIEFKFKNEIRARDISFLINIFFC